MKRRDAPCGPWLVAAGLSVLLLLVHALGEPARMLLRYERTAILAGQVWRLVTAHLVHLGWVHALLNAAGVLLCCALAPALFRPSRAGNLLLEMLALALGVSTMLLAFSTSVSHYAGLSGVLYGLFVLGLAPAALRRDRIALAALLVVLAWTAWQLLAGPSADEEALIGGSIIAPAHLYGVLTALLLLGVRALRARALPRG